MKTKLEDINKVIKEYSEDEYLRGFSEALDVFNRKFLVHVWHKKDSEKFFDEVMDTIRDLNIKYININSKYERERDPWHQR